MDSQFWATAPCACGQFSFLAWMPRLVPPPVPARDGRMILTFHYHDTCVSTPVANN